MGWNKVRQGAWDQLILVGLLRVLYYTLSSLTYKLHEAMDFLSLLKKDVVCHGRALHRAVM